MLGARRLCNRSLKFVERADLDTRATAGPGNGDVVNRLQMTHARMGAKSTLLCVDLKSKHAVIQDDQC